MKNVAQARMIFLVIAGAFLLLDVVSAVVLLSPAGRSSAERSQEFENLRVERMQKEAETRPTRDMDKKLVRARQEIGGFYTQHLPANYSDISEDVGKVASENHVSLSAVHYQTKTTPVQGLNGIVMTLSISGDYRGVMEFINGLERDKRFYVLDRVLIGDSGTGGQLRVEIEMETYLKV